MDSFHFFHKLIIFNTSPFLSVQMAVLSSFFQMFIKSFFFAVGSWEIDTENGAAVTPSRFFLFRDDFITWDV